MKILSNKVTRTFSLRTFSYYGYENRGEWLKAKIKELKDSNGDKEEIWDREDELREWNSYHGIRPSESYWGMEGSDRTNWKSPYERMDDHWDINPYEDMDNYWQM